MISIRMGISMETYKYCCFQLDSIGVQSYLLELKKQLELAQKPVLTTFWTVISGVCVDLRVVR